LKNRYHNVINIAESRSLKLLGVMKTTSPINSDVCISIVKISCTHKRSTGIEGTEVVNAIKYGTIFTNVISKQLVFWKFRDIRGFDITKELHIFDSMKSHHILHACSWGFIDLHILCKTISKD
uniref:DDE Tnp4 domain-containing protein n=1 Tax=Hymenolepis diminuta TaxID=6216 RepID=A0A0R3SHC7_HYMDI